MCGPKRYHEHVHVWNSLWVYITLFSIGKSPRARVYTATIDTIRIRRSRKAIFTLRPPPPGARCCGGTGTRRITSGRDGARSPRVMRSIPISSRVRPLNAVYFRRNRRCNSWFIINMQLTVMLLRSISSWTRSGKQSDIFLSTKILDR